MVDERKRVTVMICDLASSASDRVVDPEGILAMVRPYHRVVREQIRRVDGSMLRFLGNSIMAVLGVPRTHEDDAARAVRAGLRIVQQVEELNETNGQLPLTVRIGVATGDALVLASEVNEGLGIVGDVVNRAAALRDLAVAGSVAVAEDTYKPTQDLFEYRALAGHGASSEPAAWQPVRMTVPPGLSLLLPRSRAFIGRRAELRRLRLAFARTVATRSPGLVMVSGEPGVGKSRVVGEFLAMLQERGEPITWRLGRCLSSSESGDLWPLTEVIKGLAGILETDDPSVALTKLDRVVDREVTDAADRAWIKAGVAPLLGVSLSGGPAAATPSQVWEASKRLLHAGLARTPLVLVFEDLQNADAPTLGFVESLLSSIGDAPLLVICTVRRDFLERHPTWPSSRSRKARISLEVLSAGEAAELVRALLLPSTPAEELIRWVLDGSGGNPLYIGELVRALQERDLLIERHGIVGMAAHGRGAFPDSLQSLIAARVDALPQDEKALLQDASVAGRVFWSGVLASVGDRDEAAVSAGLGDLVERGLVRRVETTTVEGQVEYVFWHGVTRDAVYEHIPRAARVEKHRAVAEWIERLAGDRIADRAGRVAYHYSEAMELAASIGSLEESARLEDRTRHFLIAAGDAAFNVDLATALEWYERALSFTPPGHPSQPAVVSRLAHAAYRTGGLADSSKLFEEAIEGFRAERNVLGQGDTMVRFSACLWTKGESARSQAMLREAVALLEGETLGPELVRGYAALAFQKAVTEPSEEAIALADKTLALAERFGLAEERVAGLEYRGLSRCFLGDLGGVEDLRAAVALANAAGLASVVSVMFNLAFVLWPREGPAVALACYRKGLDTARRRGFRNEEMAMRAATVGPLYDLGRWSEALSIGRDVVTWLEDHGADYDRAEVEHRIAQVLLHRGDVSAAEGIVERCVAAARETGDPELTASTLVTSALVAQRKRDSRRALRLARDADAASRDQPGACRTELLPDLVRIAVAAKDLRLARRLLESPELKTTRDEHAFVTARAVLAEGEAEFRDAALLYGDAAERWEAFGLLLEQGMGRLGEGRCLAAVGAPAASSALRRAKRIFHRLGARVV